MLTDDDNIDGDNTRPDYVPTKIRYEDMSACIHDVFGKGIHNNAMECVARGLTGTDIEREITFNTDAAISVRNDCDYEDIEYPYPQLVINNE